MFLKHFEESLIFALKKCSSESEMSKKTEMAWRKMFWLIANAICEGIEKEAADKEGAKSHNDHHHHHHNNHNNNSH